MTVAYMLERIQGLSRWPVCSEMNAELSVVPIVKNVN